MDRKVYLEEVDEFTYGYETILVKDFQMGEKLKIGKFCSISSNVTIFLGGNHPIYNVSTYPFGLLYNEKFKTDYTNLVKPGNGVTIGNDVWLAHGVTIMSDVNISDGAILASNSHVNKDVGPYEIWGGNPARFIKKRFTDDQISKLLEIKWWNLDDDKINEILPYICSEDIDNFIKIFNK
jgi:acetyltransferase-like isoleucine patch superfamily enzyme